MSLEGRFQGSFRERVSTKGSGKVLARFQEGLEKRKARDKVFGRLHIEEALMIFCLQHILLLTVMDITGAYCWNSQLFFPLPMPYNAVLFIFTNVT